MRTGSWALGLLLAGAVSCSSGPERILAPALSPAVSTEDFPTPEGVDRNGNGVICRKIPDTSKKTHVVHIDDSGNQSEPCPPGFELGGVAG